MSPRGPRGLGPQCGKKEDSSKGLGPWEICLECGIWGKLSNLGGDRHLGPQISYQLPHAPIKTSPLVLVSNLRFDIDRVTSPFWASVFSCSEVVVVVSGWVPFKDHCLLSLLGSLSLPG